jgi:hypothetical protein
MFYPQLLILAAFHSPIPVPCFFEVHRTVCIQGGGFKCPGSSKLLSIRIPIFSKSVLRPKSSSVGVALFVNVISMLPVQEPIGFDPSQSRRLCLSSKS